MTHTQRGPWCVADTWHMSKPLVKSRRNYYTKKYVDNSLRRKSHSENICKQSKYCFKVRLESESKKQLKVEL